MSKIESPNVGPVRHVARKIVTVVPGAIIFRNEKPRNLDGLERAKELLKEGHGIVFVINHFSLKDPPQVAKLIFENQGLGSKKIHFPIAYHMHRRWHDEIVGKLLGVTFKPIVTKSTLDKEKNDGHPLSHGKKEFLQDALEGLEKGEVVVVAPQETRQSSLGAPKERGIGTLMAEAKRKKIKIALLFIGIGIGGVTDYSKVKGFNFFRKYFYNIGECLTSDEIMEKAGGVFGKVDRIVYEELQKIVPPDYR